MNLARAYSRYNRLHFRSRLPRAICRFGRLSDCIAQVTFSDPPQIVVHTRIKRFSKKLVLFSLLHEMAHLSSGDAGHGPKWQREMRRLARSGAFDTLW
jgi:predicted metal-dependent hydrolase